VSGEITGHSLEIVRGQIATDKGIGREIIVEFLKDIPMVTENAVRQQLAILKASGDRQNWCPGADEECGLRRDSALRRWLEGGWGYHRQARIIIKAQPERFHSAVCAIYAEEKLVPPRN
jgi:hypothetical protein